MKRLKKESYRSIVSVPVKADYIDLQLNFRYPPKSFGLKVYPNGKAVLTKGWVEYEYDNA